MDDAGHGLPPGPHGVVSYDELSARLRALRTWAGVAYREVHRRVVRDRKARGVLELPVYNTVYRCLRPGRTRLDAELVADIAGALLGDPVAAASWRQACRAIEGVATDAAIVAVSGTLPAESAGFTGRTRELTTLLAALARPPAVVAITGMAGVGKTRLAVHLAHRVMAAGGRRDLCLSVNLRGHDADHVPADPGAVLEGFLRLLGLPGGRIARLDTGGRAEELRRRLAGRRTLLLLDDAASPDQIRTLLPNTPGSVTVVTGRRVLDGLPGVVLDPFGPDESAALLRHEIGTRRAEAEPRAVAGIAEAVGHLPLALSVVSARIRADTEWTLADHLDRLTRRRADLRLDDPVARAIGLSYATLDADQRRLLRLAALHPGGGFDASAAGALTGAPPGLTGSRLVGLVAAGLLRRRAGDRFEFHDLVRVFAAERARDEESARAKNEALGRLFDHYRRSPRRRTPATGGLGGPPGCP